MLPWIDIETTGLEPHMDSILEVGLMLTLDDLTFVRATSFVIVQPYGLPRGMDRTITAMHTKNGLIRELPFGVTLLEAEQELMKAMNAVASPTPMCGSSIGFDRSFLKRYMPRLESMFHYRNGDVSSVKEFASRWRSDVAASLPVPQKLHRVIPDLHDTVNEARHYKQFCFSAI